MIQMFISNNYVFDILIYVRGIVLNIFNNFIVFRRIALTISFELTDYQLWYYLFLNGWNRPIMR